MKNQDGHSVKIIDARDRAIKLLVQHKSQVILEWPEPWPALDENTFATTAHVLIRTTVQTCIAIQRHHAAQTLKARKPITDAELLDEFMLTHYAHVVDVGDAPLEADESQWKL